MCHWAGHRLRVMRRGLRSVILPADGDKFTQDKDVKIALKLARQLKGAADMETIALRKNGTAPSASTRMRTAC